MGRSKGIAPDCDEGRNVRNTDNQRSSYHIDHWYQHLRPDIRHLNGRMNRSFSVVCCTLLALFALGVFAVPARAANSDSTLTYQNVPLSMYDSSPCNGAVKGTYTGTVNIVVHESIDAQGGGHFAMTETGFLSFVSDDPRVVPDFTAHATSTATDSFTPGNTIVIRLNYLLEGTASDGSHITFYDIEHMTISPSGTVTVSLDLDSCPD